MAGSTPRTHAHAAREGKYIYIYIDIDRCIDIYIERDLCVHVYIYICIYNSSLQEHRNQWQDPNRSRSFLVF